MNWVCPNCPELRQGSRHWSVGRHIQRKHNCNGEPISLNTGMTRSQMGLDLFPSQVYRKNGVANGRAFTPSSSYKKFQSLEPYELVEKYILRPLRQKVEFNELSDQLNSKYPQGKFGWNTTNQYPYAFAEPLQIGIHNLFGCLTFQCGHCLSFEIYPFYFYMQGNTESKTTKVDHVCPNNPLMLARYLSDIEKKIFNAEQTNLINSKLKSAVLNRWSNYNNFYLFAIKLPNSYTKGIVNISYPNPCNKSVTLQYLPEYAIEPIELDNLKDDHWANRVIREKINRVTLNDEELTDFLYTANNATFGFIKVRTKTCYEVYLMILSPLVSLSIILDNY
jgi:hypothetical protein